MFHIEPSFQKELSYRPTAAPPDRIDRSDAGARPAPGETCFADRVCFPSDHGRSKDVLPITPEGNAIPGLYVIGNDMGGFFSNSYPQMFGGTAQGKTVCFARLAALHAVTGSIYEE